MDKQFIYSEIIEKNIDEGSYVVLASNDIVDRMDEIIDPKGWDLENYRKNPVILWAHNYNGLPVGKSLWIKKSEKGLIAKIKFANTPMGQEIRQLIDEGILNAVSVGFQPTESSTDEHVISEYTKAKKPKKPCRRVYLKQELLEVSVVSVPANPSALFERAKSLQSKDLLDWIELYKKSLEPKEEEVTCEDIDVDEKVELVEKTEEIVEKEVETEEIVEKTEEKIELETIFADYKKIEFTKDDVEDVVKSFKIGIGYKDNSDMLKKLGKIFAE